MFRNLFANVRAKSPLVHNITNYVTVNDCANIVLACGASPIMADDAAEVEDITSLCAGLNLNIGTLNSRTIPPCCWRDTPPTGWAVLSCWTPWAQALPICAPKRHCASCGK